MTTSKLLTLLPLLILFCSVSHSQADRTMFLSFEMKKMDAELKSNTGSENDSNVISFESEFLIIVKGFESDSIELSVTRVIQPDQQQKIKPMMVLYGVKDKSEIISNVLEYKLYSKDVTKNTAFDNKSVIRFMDQELFIKMSNSVYLFKLQKISKS